ncbi:NYN domain-containing protein [Leptolyngbya sp. FACHB-17]|uniref:NYN domain-containing protein n=1 Tax=Leptolyngbya sp. FACHB-17 TaxID=2692803 RepID=UPI001681AC0C|nr:NYN domain-containing protein [Leptolyngbya sp. FACHB-17]MBD2078374.1 NYN domain-containing protein [Leptolyngbya sp. FACHB-17]
MAPSALQRPLQLNQQRAVIFIDAANLYYSFQELGTLIEYRELKSQLESGFHLVGVRYYTGVDSTKPEQLGFLCHLHQIDYEVIAKELVRDNSSFKLISISKLPST